MRSALPQLRSQAAQLTPSAAPAATAAPTAPFKSDAVLSLIDPCRRAYAPLAVEFVASLFFTLFTDLLSVLLVPPWPSSDHSPPPVQQIALFEGALTLALICVFRPFGSALFNPAVTLASLLTLNLPFLLGFALLFAQFFGSFFGALLFHSSVSSSAFIDASLQLGTIRTTAENLEQFGQQNLPRSVVDDFSETDANGRISPFSNRLQMFISECLCSLLIVVAHLFCDSAVLGRHFSVLSLALSVASTRVVASAVGLRSPLGQSANLGRATANAVLATIFTHPDEFIIWRFFYIHFFGAFCSAIVGAAIFWVVKCTLMDNQLT